MDPFFHTGLSISDSLKTVRKSVLIYETIIISEGLVKCKPLMATYHVGEDFLDIIETDFGQLMRRLCFRIMKCGDRLGHALALGVNIDGWDRSKSKRAILISKQDYLDNLVWLYR